MTLRSFRRFRPLQRGFSLLEMAVAMMFIGILTAGMMRVYSSNLAGFQRTNDIIGSQRRGRWALASLQDDVASIGYFALVPFNQPTGYSVTSGTQEPLMILPAPTAVQVTGPDLNNPGGALVTTQLVPNPDEIQFVGDLPLSIQASVSSATPAALVVSPVTGSLADVRAGDIVAILDANFEQFQVDATYTPGSTTLPVAMTAAATQGISQAGGYRLTPALGTHQIGVPVAIFRPNVVTRYSIQARAWDPSNPAITVPCLIRQQTAYLPGGTLINWAGVATEVIAENIDGFVVNMSFDGGGTWVRQATWELTQQAINAKLAPLGISATVPRDPNMPLWFRTFPCLIRMDVTSRSAAPRSESSSVAGQAAYVHRTQTLMVAPRNFGLPL